MARIVVFRGRGPVRVRMADGSSMWFCSCGLSRTFPFCSGAHIHVQDEDGDAVYVYDGSGRRLGRVARIVLEDGSAVEPGEIMVRELVEEQS